MSPTPPRNEKAPAATAEAHTNGELGRPANTQSQYSKLSAAVYWLSLGADLVPLYPNSKSIVRGFGVHGNRIRDKECASYYFAKRDFNIGVVLSGIAGLMCLDFDDEKVFWQWREGPGAGVKTYIERTRRGYHVFFATIKDWRIGKTIHGLEIKQSGIVTVAPSVVQGFTYHRENDFDITSPWFGALPKPFFSLSVPHRITQHPSVWSDRYDVIAKIKAANPIGPALERLLPDLKLKGDGRFQHGHCPFHKDKRASFWVDHELNTWGCFASSCQQQGTHDVINLVATANSMTNSEALRMLARSLEEVA